MRQVFSPRLQISMKSVGYSKSNSHYDIHRRAWVTLVFQDQDAIEGGGFDQGNSQQLRLGVGKKWHHLLSDDNFCSGCQNINHSHRQHSSLGALLGYEKSSFNFRRSSLRETLGVGARKVDIIFFIDFFNSRERLRRKGGTVLSVECSLLL